MSGKCEKCCPEPVEGRHFVSWFDELTMTHNDSRLLLRRINPRLHAITHDSHAFVFIEPRNIFQTIITSAGKIVLDTWQR